MIPANKVEALERQKAKFEEQIYSLTDQALAWKLMYRHEQEIACFWRWMFWMAMVVATALVVTLWLR